MSTCCFFNVPVIILATSHRDRRYDGFETRSAEAGGPAAERAKIKAISKERKEDKADLKDYEVRVKRCVLWRTGVLSLLFFVASYTCEAFSIHGECPGE